jgi:HAD superfamily hydrolase (TIGR01509 family)
MSRLEALLFDVDGTLAETEEIHRLAFNRAFGDAGLDWTWTPPLYRRLLGVAGGRERIGHFIDTCGAALPQGVDAQALIASLHRDKTRHYARLLATGGITLRPGVERVLREARSEGLRLAIVTTTSAGNVLPLLDATVGPGAADWFEVICTANEAPRKKPAADAYLWTLERLALRARDCLAIEDTANGVAAARGADLPVVVTESAYSTGESFAGAVAVLSDLGEPERPFRVLAGDAHGRHYADVGLLRLWHAEATDSTVDGGEPPGAA